jgi:hypothetical protein
MGEQVQINLIIVPNLTGVSHNQNPVGGNYIPTAHAIPTGKSRAGAAERQSTPI